MAQRDESPRPFHLAGTVVGGAYSALSLPAILAGVLITPLSPRLTLEIFGSAVTILALVVAVIATRGRHSVPLTV